MASKKKESEGIALLSMYGDEDDDMEEEEEDAMDAEPETAPENPATDSFHETEGFSEATINSDRVPSYESSLANDNVDSATPPIFNENSTPKPLNSSTPQQVPSDSGRIRSERLTIVDYGHDEAALSPEAEEGEIVGSGRVMFGVDLHTSNGELLEQTSQGTVRVLTPSTQATPQSGQHGEPQLETMECTVNQLIEDSEAFQVSCEDPKDLDPLDKFLPPPPKVKCSDELQEKIIKFLSLKKTTGRSFNSEVRNRKDYRNPDFLLHAVTYQDIDQIGTCFSKDVFDPHGYDKSDFYDEIEADMKREMERKEQEKKKSQKVEYVSGGTQLGTIPAPRVNLPIPGVSSVNTGGLHSATAPVDTVVRDGRPNKKSKWDKVDGDRRNPLPTGGQDPVPTALLSAANTGTGYSAFAQQRRREAEEKRSSDKKLDRRS